MGSLVVENIWNSAAQLWFVVIRVGLDPNAFFLSNCQIICANMLHSERTYGSLNRTSFSKVYINEYCYHYSKRYIQERFKLMAQKEPLEKMKNLLRMHGGAFSMSRTGKGSLEGEASILLIPVVRVMDSSRVNLNYICCLIFFHFTSCWYIPVSCTAQV